MNDGIIETMEEQKKMKWGIYKMVTGCEAVCNPIYTGPERKDLVLDIDQHNKVITRLLARPKGDPVSPAPEKCDDIPWLKDIPKKKGDRQWMDVKALRVLQTFLIYAGYFMLAVTLLLYGGAIRDVKEVTGKDAASPLARYLYPGVSTAAAVLGALAASLLVNKMNKWLLLSVAMFVMATMALVLPLSVDITVMSTVLALMGLSMGLFDAGGNLSLVKIWGADHESWLQALQFFYSLGLLLAHWFLEPFFKNKFHGDDMRPLKFEDIPTKKFLLIISEVDASKSPKHTDIEVQGSLVQSHGFERERVDNIGPSQSQVANFAVDNEFDFASIPTFIIAFAFLILAFYTFMRKREEKVKFASEEVEKLKEMDEDQKVPGFILVFLSFVLLVFFAAFSWLQLSIGEYLFAYAFHALHFSGKYAKAVSLVYWGTLVLGTLLGIFVIKFLRARTYTGLSLVFLSLSVLPWCFVLRCHGLVWLLSSLLGLSTSTIFASVVSWAFQHFGLSGPVGAIIMMARSLGVMLGPVTVEVVLKHFGLGSFLQITAGIIVVLSLLFIMMHFCATKYGKLRQTKDVLDVSPEPLKTADNAQPRWLHEAAYEKLSTEQNIRSSVKVHSHLSFIKREILRELVSPHNR